jgi:peptidoglycan/LPS O-acetylase OafA/YrhL
MSNPATNRLEYIDVMRAFTMFLVVMQHVDSFVLSGFNSPVYKVLLLIRMPMFFFISGFIGYKALNEWTRSFYVQRLRKKAFVQLIPATIFFLLYSLVFGINPLSTFSANGFERYWFTYVLFYMFVIYYTVSVLMRKFRCSSTSQLLLLIAMSLSMWLLFVQCQRHGVNWGLTSLFYIDRLCHYYVFFVIGLLCRHHLSLFHHFINHWAGIGMLLLCFGGCLTLIFTPWLTTRAPGIINYGVQMLVVCQLGIFLVYFCFYRLRHILANGSKLSRGLAFAGRRTLDVYLIHYFFLAPLTKVHITSGPLYVLTSVSLTVCAYLLCLCVSRAIRISPTLAHWMLGAKKEG